MGRARGLTASIGPRSIGKKKQIASPGSNRNQWSGRVKRQFIVKL